MTAETIARALGGRKVGAAWMARCPAHEDCEPSLPIEDPSPRQEFVRIGRITATASAVATERSNHDEF
jgi:hypothetical protein